MPLPFLLVGVAAAVAGVGLKKGYDGHKKNSQADNIVDSAKARYEAHKSHHDEQEAKTNDTLHVLGEDQVQIGMQLKEFKTIADDLLRKFNANRGGNLKIQIPKHTLQDIERYSFQAAGVISAMAGAGVSGAFAGFAVYGGVMALGAASTGTAISSLAGVAATNATFAAIGGGSIAAGGLGIAGGTAILSGTVLAPVVAIAGWTYNSHGEAALKNAYKVDREIKEAVIKLERATQMLRDTNQYAIDIRSVIQNIHQQFENYLIHLKEVNNLVESVNGLRTDADAEFGKLCDKVLRLVNNGYALAAILVDLITTPLFKFQEEDGQIVKDENGLPLLSVDADGLKIINQASLDKKIADTKVKASLIEAA